MEVQYAYFLVTQTLSQSHSQKHREKGQLTSTNVPRKEKICERQFAIIMGQVMD